jgi:F-type H+-transporting ATPase subunit b
MVSFAAAPSLLLAGGLTDPDWVLFYGTLVVFALFSIVLTKFGWKPLLNTIEEREHGIRTAVQGAEAANVEAKALLAKHHELVREATRERDEILKRALGEAEQLKADLASKARTEGEQLVQRARQQIEREKTLALQELKVQVADLAVEAAAKIVESSLTPEAQRKLVAEFIEQLPKAH